ncbi:MAG: methyltransferase domain-containing protein [Methylobacter sp.]
MQEKNEGIRATNVSFYENAYSGKFFLKTLLKQLLSYDQLSKTFRNLRLMRKVEGYSNKLSVLDYGFGHGTLLLRLPRRHQIFGCELSQEAISNVNALCSLWLRKVSLFSPEELVARSSTLSFDLVCCSHVIEHVDDERELLSLFRNVIQKNGHLLLNVPINEVWLDPKHIRKYTAGSTRLLLESAGFEVEELLEADRWTAWILTHEYVAATKPPRLFKLVRLFFALLPIPILDALEILLPNKYQCQQLIVLARKT